MNDAVILLVEENLHIMKINTTALKMKGYEVLCAENCAKARELLLANRVNMIIMDILLPDGNGLTLWEELRSDYQIPILFLSALSKNEEIIAGLRIGDDYLPKPYDLDVLIARIEARLRAAENVTRFVSLGALKLDTLSGIAYLEREYVPLTQKEFGVLHMLVRHADQIVSMERLYREVWGAADWASGNALWSVLSRLKQKLRTNETGLSIRSVRNKGYMLEQL